MAPRIGLAFVPTLPPERLIPLAVACDRRLDELWVWEDCFAESGVASATAALAATRHLSVGLGLMPVPLRNVALTAMEVATVHRMFPGRFLPGIGHGVQEWMGQVGAGVASPLTLLEEYAVALRRLLDGEEVAVDGRYVRLDRVRLRWPPTGRAPLLMGGTGPRTLRLCGRLGDGLLLGNTHTPSEVASAREQAASGRENGVPRSWPGGDVPSLVTILIAATGAGAQARVDAELPRWGCRPDPQRAVAGDASAVAAAVDRLADAGATTVVVQPTEDEPDLEALVGFLSEQVRPLLR